MYPKVVDVGDCQAARSPTPLIRAASTQDMLGRNRDTGVIFRKPTEVKNVIIATRSTKRRVNLGEIVHKSVLGTQTVPVMAFMGRGDNACWVTPAWGIPGLTQAWLSCSRITNAVESVTDTQRAQTWFPDPLLGARACCKEKRHKVRESPPQTNPPSLP